MIKQIIYMHLVYDGTHGRSRERTHEKSKKHNKVLPKKRIWNDQFAFLGKYTFLFITISVLITVGVS